jgi:HJR/Mrr/RecB family endonuclease
MAEERLKIFLSYSWTYLDESVRKFIQTVHDHPKLKVETIHNKDDNAGNDTANLLFSSFSEQHFFLRIFSGHPLEELHLELELKRKDGFDGHSLFVVHINFNPLLSTTLQERGTNAVVIDFTNTSFDVAMNQLLDILVPKDTTRSIISIPHGRLIELPKLITSLEERMIEHYSKYPKDMKKMDPHEFELLIAELCRGNGWNVEMTKRTRDGGYDIVAIQTEHIRSRILIECKRFESNKVSVQVVRQLGGILKFGEATQAILATTSYFTRDAKNYIETHSWALEGRDFDDIVQWIEHYKLHKNEGRSSN